MRSLLIDKTVGGQNIPPDAGGLARFDPGGQASLKPGKVHTEQALAQHRASLG